MHDHLAQIHSAQFEAINKTLMGHGQRISSLETVTEGMNNLVKAVTELTVEIKHMRSDYSAQTNTFKTIHDDHETRISNIESKPGKIAIDAWKYIIGLILTGCVGILFGIFI